jgi:hypothetical protein
MAAFAVANQRPQTSIAVKTFVAKLPRENFLEEKLTDNPTRMEAGTGRSSRFHPPRLG